MHRLKTALFSIFCLLTTATAHAAFLYAPQELGTLGTDKSLARSLNANGSVAGKFFDKDVSSDFVWSAELGLHIISSETDKEVFPKINNKDEIHGYLYQPGGWLINPAKVRRYVYHPSLGFTALSKDWIKRGDGYSVVGVNDTYTLLCDHIDVFKSSLCFFTGNGKSVYFGKTFIQEGEQYLYASAINNHSEVLVSTEFPGLFGTSLFATYWLSLYNIETDTWTKITEDNFYYGTGLNDSQMIIAKNKKGSEGFFGSKETGMQSLGDFIPAALNNANEIVGKKKNEPLLRRADGSFINLNQVTDLAPLGITKITEAWAINDQGQILVSALIDGKTHAFLLEPLMHILPEPAPQ